MSGVSNLFGLPGTVEELQRESKNPYIQWYAAGMPSFEVVDVKYWKQLVINFDKHEDRERFAEIFNYELTDNTNVVWYPEKEREQNMQNRYLDQSGEI